MFLPHRYIFRFILQRCSNLAPPPQDAVGRCYFSFSATTLVSRKVLWLHWGGRRAWVRCPPPLPQTFR